jgi:hypothetical protein
MTRFVLGGLFLAGLCSVAQAALLITADDAGEQTRQYFDGGSFLLMQGGQPAFGVDRKGNCWFVAENRLVADPCEQMFAAMGGMRDQMMAGLDPQERAMMQQMMAMRQPAQAPAVTPSGTRTIAGYGAECSRIGSRREVCVSAQLMREVEAEMGGDRVVEMFQRFGSAMAQMAGPDPEAEAFAGLIARGYPVLDMAQVEALPGMNPAMLQFVPEAQRAQLMQQFGGGTRTEGLQVQQVERNATMPEIDLSGLTRVGFTEFMQQSMSPPGALPRR